MSDTLLKDVNKYLKIVISSYEKYRKTLFLLYTI